MQARVERAMTRAAGVTAATTLTRTMLLLVAPGTEWTLLLRQGTCTRCTTSSSCWQEELGWRRQQQQLQGLWGPMGSCWGIILAALTHTSSSSRMGTPACLVGSTTRQQQAAGAAAGAAVAAEEEAGAAAGAAGAVAGAAAGGGVLTRTRSIRPQAHPLPRSSCGRAAGGHQVLEVLEVAWVLWAPSTLEEAWHPTCSTLRLAGWVAGPWAVVLVVQQLVLVLVVVWAASASTTGR